MSNEEMAKRIKAGETSLLPALWEQNRGILYLLARRYYNQKKDTCDSRGVAVEDLEQCGYFVILHAVKDYAPDKEYKFASFLRFHALNCFNDLAGLRTRRQKQEPLNNAIDIDSPVTGTDNAILSDTVEDETAKQPFEDIEQVIFIKQLHKKLDEVMEQALTQQQRETIYGRYYAGYTLKELGNKQGKSMQSVSQIEQRSLQRLRNPRFLRELQPFAEGCSWYYAGSLQSFKNRQGSTVELITESIDREKRIREIIEEIRSYRKEK